MRFFKVCVLASAVSILGGQSACGGHREQSEPDRLFAEWTAEHQGQKTGQSATFDITGSPLVLATSGVTEVTAPTTLAVGTLAPKDKRYVFFEEAQVGSQKGLLVLEGARLSLTAGTLGAVDIQGALARTQLKNGSAAPAVVLTPRPGAAHPVPAVAFPEDWSDAKDARLQTQSLLVRPSGMTLTDFTRGVLVTPSGATALSGSVTVASATWMSWDKTSRIEASSSLISSPRFALGGAVGGGALAVAGSSTSPPPGGLVGEMAQVRLEPGRARSEGAFPLAQAMTESGLLVPTEVQVAFETTPLTLKKNGRMLLSVAYREKTLRGDAVLADLQVTGSGKDAVSIAVDQSEVFVRGLWTAVADSGYTSPLFSARLGIVSPFLNHDAEGLLPCLSIRCPASYPYWMKAGTVSRFELVVDGTLPPGTYSADVTLTGRNYPAVTIPIQFTLTP